MQPKDIIEPLAKLGLPLLGAMLPIPGGAAIGTALASAIGAPSGKPEDILATLQASPDAILKAKQFEAENRTKMMELTLANEQEIYKAEVADRDSARKMESETKSYMPSVLATIIVLLYVGVQWYLLTKTVAPDMREMVMRALGTLDASLGLVLSFYFGSSASSRQKDQALADIAKS